MTRSVASQHAAQPSPTASAAPPVGCAIHDEATRSALARYRFVGWRSAVVGVPLLAIAVLIEKYTGFTRTGSSFGTVGCFALVTAGAMLRRARRWEGLLSEQPWQTFRAQHLRLNRTNAGLVLTPIDEPAVPQTVLRLDVVKWRQGLLDNDPIVWLCGRPDAPVVVTSPTAGGLFAASPPRGYFGAKFMNAHAGELASLGVSRPIPHLNRGWLAAATLFWAMAVLIFVVSISVAVKIARGMTNGKDWWPVLAFFCLLTVIIIGLALWSRARIVD